MTNNNKAESVGRQMSPLCRFDYVKIFDPRKTDIGSNVELPPEKWSQEMTCLFPKVGLTPKDQELFAQMKAQILRAAQAFYPDLDINGRKPDGSPLIKLPLLDGDAYNQSKGGKVPHYNGMIYFSVRSKNAKFHLTAESGAIGYLDDQGNVQDMLDRRMLYSGCWGRVMVSVYPNAKGTPAGLNFGLSSIIKIKDDTPLFSGGAGNAAKDFAELPDKPVASNAQMFAGASEGLNLGF